jgi:hypothetical protein
MYGFIEIYHCRRITLVRGFWTQGAKIVYAPAITSSFSGHGGSKCLPDVFSTFSSIRQILYHFSNGIFAKAKKFRSDWTMLIVKVTYRKSLSNHFSPNRCWCSSFEYHTTIIICFNLELLQAKERAENGIKDND